VNKKIYLKPKIEKIVLDYTISLQMLSGPPSDPPPRAGGKGKGNDTPFASPFGDKPFG
jgi:hypothetical protein